MRAMSDPLHLVDATMFWSPTGGGVRRYLQKKHDWLAAQPGWRHSLVVPRVADASATGASLRSWPLPGSGGYRLPMRRRAIARVIGGLAPDLIEAGDPYRVAWGALDAAQMRGVPVLAYCHSNIVAMARLAAGARLAGAAARAAERYARHLYRRFDLVLAPSRSMAAHLQAWESSVSPASRSESTRRSSVPGHATDPARAPRLERCDAAARVRRSKTPNRTRCSSGGTYCWVARRASRRPCGPRARPCRPRTRRSARGGTAAGSGDAAGGAPHLLS